MLLSTETNSVVKRFGQERAFEMLKKTGFDACDFSFYNNGVELLGDDYMKNAEKSKAMLDNFCVTRHMLRLVLRKEKLLILHAKIIKILSAP